MMKAHVQDRVWPSPGRENTAKGRGQPRQEEAAAAAGDKH